MADAEGPPSSKLCVPAVGPPHVEGGWGCGPMKPGLADGDPLWVWTEVKDTRKGRRRPYPGLCRHRCSGHRCPGSWRLSRMKMSVQRRVGPCIVLLASELWGIRSNGFALGIAKREEPLRLSRFCFLFLLIFVAALPR